MGGTSMCFFLIFVQLWVIAESLERVASPSMSGKSRASSTLHSPSSSAPQPAATPSRIRRSRPPLSIPTLHIINNFATATSRPLSPNRSVPDHSNGIPSAALSLASTFMVAGQSKVIAALPSDPAVARLPKHLAVAATRALQSNLQVPPLPPNRTFFELIVCSPGISRRLDGGSGAG
jgi:hypothetical protein